MLRCFIQNILRALALFPYIYAIALTIIEWDMKYLLVIFVTTPAIIIVYVLLRTFLVPEKKQETPIISVTEPTPVTLSRQNKIIGSCVLAFMSILTVALIVLAIRLF